MKEGILPDPAAVAFANNCLRHNTDLYVPLLWTMINYRKSTKVNGF